MSRKDKYLHDLCAAKGRICELEQENERLRAAIHRLVTMKNELLERVEECEQVKVT